jgi:hypothetical protein
MASGTRFSPDGNRSIPDSFEFELRQRLNVLTLNVWSLRRLSEKDSLLAKAAGLIARQEKTIERMCEVLNAACVPPSDSQAPEQNHMN